ncbi:MAG TPA: S8 family peptidase [Termitinemataceae bacterium]|nr:S8 family peptidase [Termitinemataceae bacterium]
MSKLPLLFFPTPQLADRTKKKWNFRNNIHKPDTTRQIQRLSPMFEQLRTAFEARKVEIQQSTAGIEPEYVLVIEIVGGVENFVNAVKRIAGFEWMGEIEVEDISPDQDFYDADSPDKTLTGRLYFVMTNQQALNELLSLWRRYQNNESFDYGLKNFYNLFTCLKSIRRWDIQDRLLETGVIQGWQEDLKHDSNRPIRFEVELWFRSNPEKRKQSLNRVTDLIRNLDGRVLTGSLYEGIAYHGMLAELPAQSIQTIINNQDVELVKCESIMFFRPVGQIIADGTLPENDLVYSDFPESSLPQGEPVIALLDGLPLANHRLLKDRLIIDDPDNFENSYNAEERVHGTAMASLIIHGDLNDREKPLKRPVYVRPIMRPNPNDYHRPRPEYVPDDVLIVDLIHRSVKRLFENDGIEKPVAPSVRVINLSIGDPSRQFFQSMSPLARLLDWLSSTYKILFIISAGNHPSPIYLNVPRAQFESLTTSQKEAVILKAIFEDIRNRKLLSPAESINNLTVGALQFDSSSYESCYNGFNPFEHSLPSPVSAFGVGYRRSIKPDIVFRGGRVLYQEDLRYSRKDHYVIKPVEPAIRSNPPGNKTAVPSRQSGNLDGVAYCCGTSNAAALMSRAASICYELLQQIVSEQLPNIDMRPYEIPLLKAMLIHGCSWENIAPHLHGVLQSDCKNKQELNAKISRWIGYGHPEIGRVLYCTEQRATVLGFGQLSDGQAHIFRLPLPPSLSSQTVLRRLTVTLAWLSPVLASNQKYRVANLWFEVNNNGLTSNRKNTDWQAVRRGTVQHEVFEGEQAEPFNDGDVIEIKVNCREDAGKIQSPIAYGLIVSLEVAEGVNIAVYNEIQTRITSVVQIQQVIGGV